MKIKLNGEERTAGDGLTVRGLLVEAGLDPAQKGVAVAVNAEIVPRGAWDSARLQDGDRIDVIRAVQGG